jgi:pyoverdine/dityrosine biosynthesis protein Dit1
MNCLHSSVAVERVVDCFDRMLRLPASHGDAFEPEGRLSLTASVQRYVDDGEPVAWLLPGFAFKNPNPDKTLGRLPDRAEHASLSRLLGFCRAVREVYAPGVRITVFSGGWVWAGPLGVSVEDVLAYWRALQEMVPARSDLRFSSLDRLWGVSPLEALERTADWARDDRLADFEDRLLQPGSEDTRRVLDRFLRLMAEDRVAEPGPDFRRTVMRAMLQHDAFGATLAAAFPRHIRLSVHECRNGGPKFGVRLLEHAPPGLLPYHCTVLGEDGVAREMFAKEARTCGGGLVLREGRPWCLAKAAGN